jgi:Flp pilus assembly protein TadG
MTSIGVIARITWPTRFARPARALLLTRCGHHLRSRDDGSAIIEFTVLSVCLIVPLLYIVLALMQVQSAAYAITQAAREAGRAYVLAPTPAVGQARAQAAMRLALSNHGLPPESARLSLRCRSGACLAAGSAVTVEVAMTVDLPLLPTELGAGTGIPVSSTHVATVDRLRSPR